jgi:thiol:disulfide interchange protein
MRNASPVRRRLLALAAALSMAPFAPRTASAADLPDRFDPKRDAAADVKTALERAAATGRRVLVYVGGEWCTWCHVLDRFFTAKPELKRLRDNWYVVVKVNWSPENTNAALLKRWPAITGYPHFFVLDAGGRLLHSQQTSALESGSTYDAASVRAFLVRWAPGSRPNA